MPVINQTDVVVIEGKECSVKQINIDVDTIATHMIIAAIVGKKIRVICGNFNCSASNTLTFKSGTTALGRSYKLSGNDTLVIDRNLPAYFLQTEVGEAFQIELGSAQQVSGSLNYIEV